MDLSSKITGDIAVSFLMKIALKVRGLLLIPLLSILIGVAEYGAYVQVVAITTLVANLCSLRLDSGYVRYKEKTEYPTGLYTSLVLIGATISIFGGILFAMASGLLAKYTLQDQQFSLLFLLGGIYIPLKCLFQIGRGYFRAEHRIKLYSLLEAINVYLSITLISIAVLVAKTWIVGAFAAFLIAHGMVVVMIYGLIVYHGGFGWPDTTVLFDCLRFSIGSVGHLVSQSLLDKIDRILLGFFLGASAVGIYSAAYSVAYLILLYFRPLSISFFPEFTKLWENGDKETIQSYSVTGFRFIIMLGLPTIAGLWLVGDAALNILSTETVASAGLLPLVLLATGMLLKGIEEVYAQLFFAVNDARTPAIIQGGVVVLNFVLNIILIPITGTAGAALTTLISFLIAAGILRLRFQTYIPIGLPWGEVARVTVATSFMTLLMLGLGWNWIRTVITAPVVYFTLLFIIGGIERSEIRFVIKSVLW